MFRLRRTDGDFVFEILEDGSADTWRPLPVLARAIAETLGTAEVPFAILQVPPEAAASLLFDEFRRLDHERARIQEDRVTISRAISRAIRARRAAAA